MTKINKRQAFWLEPILVIATSNPKKRPSMSYDRFNNYFLLDNTIENTVQDALDLGLRMDDIRHDSEHGFIAVGEQAIADYRERAAADKERRIEEARQLLAAVDSE